MPSERRSETITPVHVEENIGISKDYNQFELQNALGKKDVLKANRIINYFAENQKNHHITQTISSLYYFFSKLLLIHYIKDRSKQNVAATLKINPFFVQDYEAAARRYSAAKLVEIISLLRTYDMRSKGYNGNTTPAGELMRELIFKILHPPVITLVIVIITVLFSVAAFRRRELLLPVRSFPYPWFIRSNTTGSSPTPSCIPIMFTWASTCWCSTPLAPVSNRCLAAWRTRADLFRPFLLHPAVCHQHRPFIPHHHHPVQE